MNIREHIEAGHYPKDDKGRALVPSKQFQGAVLTVLATDGDPKFPILGWLNGDDRYSARPYCADSDLLLPPPPRKVIRWAALSHEQLDALGMYESDGPAQREVCGGKMLARIEYEVKW